jgi:hypothetical protein
MLGAVGPDHDDAAQVIEAQMPVQETRANIRAVATASGMVAAAALIISVYVGLPLALLGQNLLHALPNALQLAIGVLTLTVTGVSAVLTRTSGSSNERSRHEASRASRIAHRAPATLPNESVGRPVEIPRPRPEADHGKHWNPYQYVPQNAVAVAIRQ